MADRSRDLAGSGAPQPTAIVPDLGRARRRSPAGCARRRPSSQAGPPVRVLDVGCGVKPYYPFFAGVASEYVGVDVVENPAAELLGPVEALPVADASFDVVLCTQVLEHCDDPAQAVRELRRVTAPGGRVLASTHGVQVYHPSPVDYWRWTHEGLRAPLRAERRLVDAVGRARRRHRVRARDAARHVRRDRAAADASSRGRPSGCSTRAGAALDARSATLREPGPGIADPELPRRRDAGSAPAPPEHARRLRGLRGGDRLRPRRHAGRHPLDRQVGVRRLVVHRLGHDLSLGARLRRRPVDRPVRGRGARPPAPTTI